VGSPSESETGRHAPVEELGEPGLLRTDFQVLASRCIDWGPSCLADTSILVCPKTFRFLCSSYSTWRVASFSGCRLAIERVFVSRPGASMVSFFSRGTCTGSRLVWHMKAGVDGRSWLTHDDPENGSSPFSIASFPIGSGLYA